MCMNIVVTLHVKPNQLIPLYCGHVASSLTSLNKNMDDILNMLGLHFEYDMVVDQIHMRKQNELELWECQ